jgi:hypothetical protein
MNIQKLQAYLSSDIYLEKLKSRLEIQQQAEQNFFKRQEIILRCQDDPIYFIENFCWTFEPRLPDFSDVEFFLFDYQKEVIKEVLEAEIKGEDRLFEKSRDLGFTWLMSCYLLWCWLFKKGWIGLWGGRKQEEVDNKTLNSAFGKLRFNLYRLPKWLMPKNFKKKLCDNENKLINPENGSLIQGESSNPNFGRDRRSSIAVCDELFLQEYGEEMWRNLTETSRCRIGVSTPKPTRFAKSLKDGMKENGWLRSYHWKQHPFKDDEWYESEKKRYAGDEVGLKRELELEYLDDQNILVYPQAELIKIVPHEYDRKSPLYVSMDWGIAPSQTVFYWWQRQNNKWILLEGLESSEKPFDWYLPYLCLSFEPSGRYIYNFAEKQVLDKVRSWNRPIAFFGEAAHQMRSMTSATSVASEFAKYGITIRYNPNAISHEKRQIATKELIRQGVEFNDTHFCRSCLDALIMSRFPKTSGITEKQAPLHDEYADARSAVENFAVNIVRPQGIREIVYNKKVIYAK